MLAKYHGEDTHFLKTNNVYELVDVTPDEATDFHYRVVGVPGRFFYETGDAFENEWTEMGDVQQSTGMGKVLEG